MYEYKGTIRRVIDGDTLVIDVDLGFHVHTVVHVRLAGINAPETRGEERALGKAATRALEDFLVDIVATLHDAPTSLQAYSEMAEGRGCPCVLRSFKGRSFTRWVANVDVLPLSGEPVNVGAWMVENGHAELAKR